MRAAKAFFARLLRNAGGNVLPIAAAGMLVAAGFVGSAIDISRDFKVTNQLQAACDAGVLAGRRTVTTSGLDTASKTAAQNYFNTNFDDSMQEARGTNFVVSSDDDGKTVNGVATTTLDTLIMRLFGNNSFNIKVTCASSMGVGNADVMMVLDTTGSMASALGTGTRISALQQAMKDFQTTLENATVNSNARIRYGFVPYSTNVNVGKLLLDEDPDYLTDKFTYQSRKVVTKTVASGYKTTVASSSTSVTYSSVTSSSSSKGTTKYTSSANCTNALTANDADFKNYGSSSSASATTYNAAGQKVVTVTVTQPQRKYTYSCSGSGSSYYIYTSYQSRTMYTATASNYDINYVEQFDYYLYTPREWDTSAFKTFAKVTVANGSSGANASYTWGGCIQERQTTSAATFTYSATLGKIEPTTALDVDLDQVPDKGNENTKWAPLWPGVTYGRTSDGSNYTTDDSKYGVSLSSYCPVAAQQLEEMSKDDFEDYADSLVATGSTYLDTGIIWGGRLLSPQGLFADNVNDPPSNGGEVSRHIVFMTDGFMEPSLTVNQAWGVERWDRKVTGTATMTDSARLTADTARHTQRFLAACEAIKDKGIRIWVIAFTSALSTDLKTCASSSSSFTAASSTQLSSAFQEIAKQVGELRVTK